jgi:hypothetical protein
VAIYYSLGVEGKPFGQPMPSEQAVRDLADKNMHEFNDIERIEILMVTTVSFGYQYRKGPVTHEVKPVRKQQTEFPDIL